MRRRVSLAISVIVATAMLSAAPAATASDPSDTAGTETTAAVPQMAQGIIVKASETSEARRESIARTADPTLPDDTAIASTSSGPGGMALLSFDEPVDSADLDPALDAVRARPDVEWAIPNAIRFARGASPVTPNDPKFAAQLNLWDSRAKAGRDNAVLPDGGYSTRAPALWPATKGAGAVVAVVDTGITTHEDLAGQTLPGYDFVDDEYTCTKYGCSPNRTYISAGDGSGWDSDPSDPGDWRTASMATSCGFEDPEDWVEDSSWHGTHVAGIVAATQDNSKGISGVAPAAKILPVRVLGHCGGTDWNIAMGILWAAGEDINRFDTDHGTIARNAHPADVVNLSLGGEVSTLSEARDYCEFYGGVASFANAKGATLVAAAGNASGTRVADHRLSIPSACPGYVSVASVSDTGHRAWYSTAGAGVDVAAQGGDLNVEGVGHGIVSTVNAGTTSPTSATTTYDEYQGTSMAAPAVAAAAALLHARGVSDPALVEKIIEGTSRAFPARSTSYRSLSITRTSGETIRLADLNCTTASCGAGILDVSSFASIPLPTSRPRISGTAAVGRTLTATSGTWIQNTGGSLRMTWYRGSRAVSSGSTYRVTAADLGQTVSVRVTATGASARVYGSAAKSVAKSKSKVSISMASKVKKTKRARLKVKVSAPYVRATGTIRVYDGKRRIAVTKLTAAKKGRVTVKLPKLKKGKHRIKVVYSGSTQVSSGKSKVKKVTSR